MWNWCIGTSRGLLTAQKRNPLTVLTDETPCTIHGNKNSLFNPSRFMLCPYILVHS